MTKHVAITAEASAALTLKHIQFRDISIAAKNVRAREGADPAIPRLADTIAAVGILVPLFVRTGGLKDPKSKLALDDRRRLLALELLIASSVIADDYPGVLATTSGANGAWRELSEPHHRFDDAEHRFGGVGAMANNRGRAGVDELARVDGDLP